MTKKSTTTWGFLTAALLLMVAAVPHRPEAVAPGFTPVPGCIAPPGGRVGWRWERKGHPGCARRIGAERCEFHPREGGVGLQLRRHKRCREGAG